MTPFRQPGRLLELSFVKIRDLLVELIQDNEYYEHDEETDEVTETLEDSVVGRASYPD